MTFQHIKTSGIILRSMTFALSTKPQNKCWRGFPWWRATSRRADALVAMLALFQRNGGRVLGRILIFDRVVYIFHTFNLDFGVATLNIYFCSFRFLSHFSFRTLWQRARLYACTCAIYRHTSSTDRGSRYRNVRLISETDRPRHFRFFNQFSKK